MSVDLNKLDGRIITFESVRFPGWFIDSRDKSTDEACITMLPPSKRVDPNEPDSDEAAEWPQWIVRVRERDDVVSFESSERPGYYLDLSHWKGHGHFNKVLVTWVSQLHSVGKWGQFRIKGNMNDATIQSRRWTDRWLCAQKRKKVMGGQGPDRFDEWGHWIIKDVFAGADKKKKPKEEKRNVESATWVDTRRDMSCDNGVIYEITVGTESTEGVDDTYGKTISVGFSQNYSLEFVSKYGGARAGFGMSSSNSEENSRTRSMTTSTSTQREMTMAPPPGTKAKKYTAFTLRVKFDVGEDMLLMAQMVPTDRLLSGMFNPTKRPKMLPNKALLDAIEAVYMMT